VLFQPKQYLFPETIEDAIKLLSESEDCLIVSGGVTLHELEKRDLLSNIRTLIDLSRLGLNHIRSTNDSLEIESSVTFSSLVKHESVRQKQMYAIVDCLEKFTPVQIRNLATIGGAICSAVPFLDIPTVFSSLAAKLVLIGPNGERIISIRNFYHDFFQTDLNKNELMIKAVVEKRLGRTGSAFQSFKRTAVDIPIINVSAFVSLKSDNSCEEVSVYIGGVDKVVREGKNFEDKLAGSVIDDKSIENGLDELNDLVSLESFHAGLAYKRRIMKLITKEVVLRATERARSNNVIQEDSQI
jgi:CO/xanthine dehydrogenase FAD-binding subunit